MRRISSLLVAVALIAPACGQPASAQERIAGAPGVTAQQQSALFEMDIAMTGGQQDLAITAEGGVDFANQRSAITMNLGEAFAGGGLGQFQMITNGSIIYLQLPNAEQLGVATPWVKLDANSIGGVQGLGELQQFGTDPSNSMAMLRGVSEDITEVGSEQVRGVATTHYSATVDLNRAIEDVGEEARAFLQQQIQLLGSSTVPIEVWIDGEGRLRRQRTELDLGNVGGGEAVASHVSTTFEMFDFGATVEAQPPPPGDVTDFADMGLGG